MCEELGQGGSMKGGGSDWLSGVEVGRVGVVSHDWRGSRGHVADECHMAGDRSDVGAVPDQIVSLQAPSRQGLLAKLLMEERRRALAPIRSHSIAHPHSGVTAFAS